MKALRILRSIALWALLIGGFATGFAQITPVAWYNFHDPIPGKDVTGNGFDLNMNLNNLITGSHQPVLDSFFVVQDIGGGLQPHINTRIDGSIVFEELSMEFWFRANKDFFGGEFLKWSNKAYFYLFDKGLTFTVIFDDGSLASHTIRFDGTGPNDMHGFYDGTWHHIAATYDTKTGTIQLFVDGLNPTGYTHHSGSQAPLNTRTGNFYPSTYIVASSSSADLDEIAIYDTVMPPALIWQHYQDGLSGTPYAQTATLTPPAFPWNVANGDYDSLDYAAGYPIAIDAAQQLANYPLPRHRQGHEMQRMVPWFAKSIDIGTTGPPVSANAPLYCQRLQDYALRLATEFNYYLFMGEAKEYVGLDTNLHTYKAPYWLSQLGRNTTYDSLPRFAFVNYGQVNAFPSFPALLPLAPLGISSVYKYDNFPPRSYGRTPSGAVQNPPVWSWAAMANPTDSRQDTLRLDGVVMRSHLEAMEAAMPGNSHLALLGDNGEMLFRQSVAWVTQDTGMNNDLLSTTFTVGEYQAARARQLRELVSAQYRFYQDSLNASYGDSSTALYWYNVGGKVETSHFEYPMAAGINQFEDSIQRATPYFYPQTAARWRYGYTNVTGIQQMLEGRREELVAGSNRFFPAVSPGYNDGVAGTTDRRMLRPGQFLGLMKYLAMLGADSYGLFMYEGSNSIYIPGSHKAWHAATLAYAQGMSSRIQPFFEDGYVLSGDSGSVFGSTYSHTLNTGDPLDLVGARRLNNSPEFVISGSIMKLNNFTGQGPKAKDVCFTLSDSTGVVFDTMAINIRAQGSTYVLDLSGQDTVFYQVDAWHEWSEPGHWCRDFAFEAEVVDTVLGGATTIQTERLSPHSQGDFRDFTSWLDLAGGNIAVYNFGTRQADQDSLRFWVHARSGVLGSSLLNISIDGSLVGQMQIAGGPWQWYGLTSSQMEVWLNNLGIAKHQLRLGASAQGVEIDKILLARSPDDFTSQTFSPVASAVTTTICNEEALEVSAGGGLPGGCLEFHWNFGDAVEAHTPSATHVYSYPGTYEVILTVTHPCLDTVAFDTLQIIVDAPFVDAGRDTFVCASVASLQLQGEASYFFKWREADLVSSPIIQNPIATLNESGYLHLDAWDPLTGCHASDSVYVTLVENKDVRDTVINLCRQTILGNAVGEISVSGGYHVWWAPDSRLSNTAIRRPIATIPLSVTPSTFTAYLSDICRCDTDTVIVTVNASFLTGLATADPDTICEGDTTALLVTGMMGNIRWTRPFGAWMSSSTGANPLVRPRALGSSAMGPQNSIFKVTGLACNGFGPPTQVTLQDTITLIPQPFLGINNWKDTIWACPGTPITGLGIDAVRPTPSAYQWSPGTMFNDSTILMPTFTTLPSGPIEVSLTLHSPIGCPKTYTAVLMPSSISPDSLYQCPGDSLSFYLGPNITNVNWKPNAIFSHPFSASTTVSVPSDRTITVSYENSSCGLMHDTINIIVHGLPQIAEDTVRVCDGDTAFLNTTGAFPVVWGPIGTMVNDSTSDSTWTILNGQAMTLYVASCDSFFCPGFDSVVVTWPEVITGPDSFLICIGDTVGIYSINGLTPSCLWTPTSNISNSNDCDIYAWPTASTYYTIRSEDNTGCVAFDSVWVEVDTTCCYVPNVDLHLFNAKASDIVAAFNCSSCTGLRLHVIDTLLIDTTITLIDCHLLMDSMAVVWIPGGDSLTLEGCNVTAACNYMWDGIYIQDSTAYLETRLNTLIQDGEFAVSSQKGGIFNILDSRFENNYVGIRVTKKVGLHRGTVVRSRFEALGPQMLAPHWAKPAECGMWIRQVDSIVVGPADWQNRNRFSELGIGILSELSNVLVQNCHFSNMTFRNGAKGEPGYDFYNTGIVAKGHAAFGSTPLPPRYTVHVGGDTTQACRFVDIHNGIWNVENSGLDAQNNRFVRAGFTGIRVGDCHHSRVFISKNDFIDGYISIHTSLNTGMDFSAVNNKFNYDVGFAGIGLSLNDLDPFGNPQLGNSQYLVEGNQFKLAGTGIFAQGCGGINIIGNNVKITGTSSLLGTAGIRVRGCNSAKIKENFLRALAPNGTAFDGINLEYSSSSTVTCNTIRDFNTSFHTFGSCEFSYIRYNTFRGAETGMLLEFNGVIGEQGGQGDPSGNKWSGAWNCGGAVSKVFSLNTNIPPADRFYVRNQPNQNPNIGGCNIVIGGTALPISTTNGNVQGNCPPLPPSGGGGNGSPNRSMLAIADSTVNYAVYPDASLYLDRQLLLDTLEADMGLCQSNSLLGQCHASLRNSNMGKMQRNLARLNLQKADSLLAENAFAAVNQIEVNTQALSLILDRYLAKGLGISLSDSLVLESIAIQCPLTGGKAVPMARVVLEKLHPGRYFDNGLCESNVQKAAAGVEEELLLAMRPQMRLHPNPSNGFVILELSAFATVRVFDLHGREMKLMKLEIGAHELDLSALSKGLYLVQCHFLNGAIHSQRLVLD